MGEDRVTWKNTSGWGSLRFRIVLVLVFVAVSCLSSEAGTEGVGGDLFPAGLAERQWVSFEAEGFASPVTGVIYPPTAPPCCGVPLGGVGTGCIDLDARGTFGFIAAFNQLFTEYGFSGSRGNVFKTQLTRKLPDYTPFLGVTASDTTWVLASKEILKGGTMETCVDPVFIGRKESVVLPAVEGVLPAHDIRYWGHFPVVDMEYDLVAGDGTPAPISVGLRAWSPFLPGDTACSNTPCAFFQVRVRNESKGSVDGKVVFTFPGPPHQGNPKPTPAIRNSIQESDLEAVEVVDGTRSYALGLIGQPGASFGGGLYRDGGAWAKIAGSLPSPSESDRGTSVSASYSLAAGETTQFVFVLAWYAPVWEGAEGHRYTAMYARRFASAREVVLNTASRWESLLKRILAWQQVIYSEPSLPGWLQDCLINNLALIPETSYWAQANPPLGDWCYQGGLFGMLESPRGCPQIECIPCTWYGGLPVALFFPDLARSTLTGFQHFMREDGAAPFFLGRWGPPDMATPGYDWQISLNGPCFIHLVDRLWQITGSTEILKEFYPSVQKVNTLTVNLSTRPDSIIRMPDQGGMEWFEWGQWLGMASHMGGLRLATLRIVERMARAIGDQNYTEQCHQWFLQGSHSMEEKLWAGSYYFNYLDDQTGQKSDAVMAYQMDGEWAARLHGVESVFREDRIPVVLNTIREKCTCEVICGALSFASPEGKPLSSDNKVAEYGATAMFLPEIMILAMTYMYHGDPEYGTGMLHKTLEKMVCEHGHPWDLPNMILGTTGDRHFGTDYYQNLMLWAVPAAIKRESLTQFTNREGFVDRIVNAAKGE
jgi:uncharacterized protein (DUF608 family)